MLAGRIATIQGVVSRPGMDQKLVELKEFEASAGRWVCRIKGGEQLRIRPEKLVPTAETGQKFLR